MAEARDLADRYEELRCRALGGGGDGHRLGLGVLRRQGVAAWMRAWDGISPAPAPVPPDGPGLVGDVGTIVAVLAAMALACSPG